MRLKTHQVPTEGSRGEPPSVRRGFWLASAIGASSSRSSSLGSTLTREWITVLGAYLAIGLFVCFFRLGVPGLISMEGMVVDGAQHMLETGDWLIPHVYDEVYTYKPALAHWLSAAALRTASGSPSELLVRLPFAANGFLLGLGTLFLIGRELRPRTGLLSAIAVIGGGLFVQKVRMAEYDILLTFGVGIAVLAACCNLARSRCRTSLWVLGYFALAVGFLAKGAPALMAFAPGLLVAAAVSGSFRRLWRAPHLAGVIVFATIAGGYLVAVYSVGGGEAFAQPVDEAQWRGLHWTLDSLGRTLLKPLFIAVALLPWSLLLPEAIRTARESKGRAARLLRVAAGFLAAGTAAFMLVPTHEMRYYLPLVASAGIFLGVTADDLIDRSAHRLQVISTLGLATLTVTACILGMFIYPWGDPAALTLAIGLAGLVVASRILQPTGARVVALLVIISLLATLTESVVLMPRRASTRNLRPVADQLRPVVPPYAAVYVLGPACGAGKHASMLFYLGRPIRTFSSTRELGVGSYVVLTSKQRQELTLRQSLRLELLRAVPHHGRIYELYRVRIRGV